MDKSFYESEVARFTHGDSILIPGLALQFPCYLERANAEQQGEEEQAVDSSATVHIKGMRLIFNVNEPTYIVGAFCNATGDTLTLGIESGSYERNKTINLAVEPQSVRVLDVSCNREIRLLLDFEGPGYTVFPDSFSRKSEWQKAGAVGKNAWRLDNFGVVDTVNGCLGHSLEEVKEYVRSTDTDDDGVRNCQEPPIYRYESMKRIRIRYEMDGKVDDLVIVIETPME